jgi:hypothetical protein
VRDKGELMSSLSLRESERLRDGDRRLGVAGDLGGRAERVVTVSLSDNWKRTQ